MIATNISMSGFVSKLEKRWEKGYFVCVGLDSDYNKLPAIVKKSKGDVAGALTKFNRSIIDTTAEMVCAYKVNSAFYEGFGLAGLTAMEATIKYIKGNYPKVIVILDYKRGDIGNTNFGYVKYAFEILKVDAVTVNPYLGREALAPFLKRIDKGIIVLAKTSNPGAGEFQDLLTGDTKEPLYKVVARNVAGSWNGNGNCALVVGATYPKELAEVRVIVGDMPILIPGIGAQGGDLEATVRAGRDSRNAGMIINSSRGIIFASKGSDFAEAARAETQRLTDEINRYIEKSITGSKGTTSTTG